MSANGKSHSLTLTSKQTGMSGGVSVMLYEAKCSCGWQTFRLPATIARHRHDEHLQRVAGPDAQDATPEERSRIEARELEAEAEGDESEYGD